MGQRGWTTQGLFRGRKAPARLRLKCEEQITSFSCFQGSSSRMTSVIRTETTEGKYCSKIEDLLPWVQVSELYTNAFLAPGRFGITYSHICRDASSLFP